MALSAAALTTLATALDELDVEDDADRVRARVERYIEGASSLIAIMLGAGAARQVHEGTVVQRVRGMDHPTIILSTTPIVSIESIAIGDAVVDPDDYEIADAAAGFVDRIGGLWPAEQAWADGAVTTPRLGTERTNITVTYTAGWRTPAQGGTRTLPFAIEQACLALVRQAWHSRGTDPRLISTTNTGSTYQFSGLPVPPEVLGALEPFMRIAA